MSVTRFLTGITTSGTPHLGNYVGSIRPSVRASLRTDVESFYFLADYHALIKVEDPARIQRSTLEIAASWLAAGLDPERVTFYRQSDIPEIPELTWFLTCVTGKGILNRAHAYKAAVDKNTAAGTDTDADVTAGLFMYPVLMGADILMFNAHKVPVGRDQVQHLEMARDMANSFNHRYGQHFVLPEVVIEESVATLPGTDGRKMSKSYDNTIPLFASRAQLKKLIGGIVTDSRAPGEPKEVEGSALFQIYQAFASDDETSALRQAYASGIGWADAKQMVFERLDREITPMRERYEALIATRRHRGHPAALALPRRASCRPPSWPAAPRRGPAQPACLVGGCQGRQDWRRQGGAAVVQAIPRKRWAFHSSWSTPRAPAAAKPGIRIAQGCGGGDRPAAKGRRNRMAGAGGAAWHCRRCIRERCRGRPAAARGSLIGLSYNPSARRGGRVAECT
jgi:tryptophanyl-tRNA synthetase